MKKIKFFVLVISAGLFSLSCGSGTTETDTTTSETESTTMDSAASDASTGVTTDQTLDTTSFPVMAASSDMFEITSSQQAQQKATNAEVKQFAAQMITDHTKTTEELKALTSKKNISLPATPAPKHERLITALSTEEASAFDEEYMEAQVMAHQEAVTLFESASTSETDPELKAFATKHLPHLKMHLDKAKTIKDKVD